VSDPIYRAPSSPSGSIGGGDGSLAFKDSLGGQLAAAVIKPFVKLMPNHVNPISGNIENFDGYHGTVAIAEMASVVISAAARSGKVVEKMAGTLGKEGETVIRGAYEIGDKSKIFINGRVRFPDGINPIARTLSEVKNAAEQSFTRQLRDYLQYAKQEGLRFDLYTRPDTKISKPLQEVIDKGQINHIKDVR
jgi:hypothetical protein